MNLSSEIKSSNINEDKILSSSAHVYQGEFTEAIDFPAGPVGGSSIRMNGAAERFRWQIFNNWEEKEGSGIVPNSFFAIRTENEEKIDVRTLQTVSVGQFKGMKDLKFQGEYPFALYDFVDEKIPVDVKLEVFNPLIPTNLKDSSIPCNIYRIYVKNNLESTLNISILATQQNAVGYDGYGEISGENSRYFRGYGENENLVIEDDEKTSIKMTGNAGSMQLSSFEGGMFYSASWENLENLYADFYNSGKLEGLKSAKSANIEKSAKSAKSEKNEKIGSKGITIDGALAKTFHLEPGQEIVITFVLSWHLPGGTFGRSDVKEWFFPSGGQQYENWWNSAGEVDEYVSKNFEKLVTDTQKFHDSFYSTTLPGYVLDRITAQLSVLRAPTSFWTKNGYFGVWESTSDVEEWFGNCKHVYHYAQTPARVFPELGKIMRTQDINSQTPEGLFPSRDGESLNAIDGHLGTILGICREHLLSEDDSWLNQVWKDVKRAMDYFIREYDHDKDGMISGKSYHNTLDCNVSGTSPWIGSLYLAALKACVKMSDIVGDSESKNIYIQVLNAGIANQDSMLWDEKLGYYIERAENIEKTLVIENSCSIDMFLGQWWANQLDLGQIYPKNRTIKALLEIYKNNKVTNDGTYKSVYRTFLGKGDIGWIMFYFPDKIPANHIAYYNEVMSGFEYAFAASLIQYGLFDEGMDVIKCISDRYDGRFRGRDEVTCQSNACVYGSGSPFGEDECGDFYGRPFSNWSVLLAFQGFIYDGSKSIIGFKTDWKIENHVSFFTAANGWGVYRQTVDDAGQKSIIELKYGSLKIKEIILKKYDNREIRKLNVEVDNNKKSNEVYKVSTKNYNDSIHIILEKEVNLTDIQSLEIRISYNQL